MVWDLWAAVSTIHLIFMEEKLVTFDNTITAINGPDFFLCISPLQLVIERKRTSVLGIQRVLIVAKLKEELAQPTCHQISSDVRLSPFMHAWNSLNLVEPKDSNIVCLKKNQILMQQF